MPNEDEVNGSDGEDAVAEVQPAKAAWPDEVTKTGDGSVDAVLSQLQGLPDLPTAEQTQAYTEMHDSLRYQLDADGDSD